MVSRLRIFRLQCSQLSRCSEFARPTLIPRVQHLRASSTTTNIANDVSGTSSAATDTANPAPVKPLPLSEPSPDTDAIQLNVDSKRGIKLDHLGPMVVNRDGTLSRIANWQNMADIERQNTLRILGKRNQLRLNALKDEDAGGSSAK